MLTEGSGDLAKGSQDSVARKPMFLLWLMCHWRILSKLVQGCLFTARSGMPISASFCCAHATCMAGAWRMFGECSPHLKRNIHAASIGAGFEGGVEGDSVWVHLLPQAHHILQKHQGLCSQTHISLARFKCRCQLVAA